MEEELVELKNKLANLDNERMMSVSRYFGPDVQNVTYRPTVSPYKIVFKSTDNVVLLNFSTNETRGFSGFKSQYKTIKTVYDCGQKH